MRSWAGGAAASALGLSLIVLLLVDRHQSQVELYEWKGYEAPSNVFDDWDKGYSAGPWKPYKAPTNVFAGQALADADHKWKPYSPPDNVFDELPDKYPFDETKMGHEWKKWDEGDTASERLHEPNVFDSMQSPEQSLAAFQLAEHSNGAPYRDFKPDKNVYDSLVAGEDEHEWGKTARSVPEKNVFEDHKFPDY